MSSTILFRSSAPADITGDWNVLPPSLLDAWQRDPNSIFIGSWTYDPKVVSPSSSTHEGEFDFSSWNFKIQVLLYNRGFEFRLHKISFLYTADGESSYQVEGSRDYSHFGDVQSESVQIVFANQSLSSSLIPTTGTPDPLPGSHPP